VCCVFHVIIIISEGAEESRGDLPDSGVEADEDHSLPTVHVGAAKPKQ
jgi:hypothetical protein